MQNNQRIFLSASKAFKELPFPVVLSSYGREKMDSCINSIAYEKAGHKWDITEEKL
jgi:hypothetical protein